jgi:hypothetical protein
MAIGTTAAILGAAGIGAAGSVASGMIGSKAAGKAADSQVQAALIGADVQKSAIQQSRIDSYPWALAGAQALYAYMGELGIPMPKTPILPDLGAGPFGVPGSSLGGGVGQNTKDVSNYTRENFPWQRYLEVNPSLKQGSGVSANSEGRRAWDHYLKSGRKFTAGSVNTIPMTAKKGFQETPGYQFQIEQGEKGVLNNMAALGMKNSGAALKALTRFRTGLASQEYGTYLNRLAGAAGMGQSQVNTNNSMMTQGAQGIASSYGDVGAARASGYVGQANAWSNALGGMAYNAGGALGAFA